MINNIYRKNVDICISFILLVSQHKCNCTSYKVTTNTLKILRVLWQVENH